MGAGQVRACWGFCWGDSQPSGSARVVGKGDLARGAAAARKGEQEDRDDRQAPQASVAEGVDVAALAANSRYTWVPPQGDSADGLGGKASTGPAPEPKVSSGPITLEVLQGQWLSGNGTQISITGMVVYMNGVLLRRHGVELREDGTVIGIGQLKQVEGWAECGGIQFRANSAGGQYMEFAPKEVWTRQESLQSRDERLRLLGYAGAAASHEAGTRGVEGCIPGTLCQWMPSSKDEGGVELLQTLIVQWREPEMRKVHSSKVVPDIINRESTGIGVELVHYIATSIREKGFKKRQERSGHDIPVVVYEPPGTDSHREALEVWKERVTEEHGFPPVRINDDEDMFTSLGNGHFFQALNLYACQWPALNESGKYANVHDENLHDAIMQGVPSIVLKSTTPRPVRARIALLLNSTSDSLWTFGVDGNVDMSSIEERTGYTAQFERMSKHIPGEGAYTRTGGTYERLPCYKIG